MNYDEARAYAAGVGKTGIVMGLESMKNLMRELSDVQDELPVIHIAGTNGKGSVGAFLEAALLANGKKVGRYTSPAVFEPLEVWRVNGNNMSEEEYARGMSEVREACRRMTGRGLLHPTLFEMETALAFLWFYRENCDYVLLETGMGGDTDATNIIKKPVCAVITSVSMDHMKFLGDSIEAIAAAKAGIIKCGCPAASVRQCEAAAEVIAEAAERAGAPLLIADAEEAYAQIRKAAKACGQAREDAADCVGECETAHGLPPEISYDYPGVGRISPALAGTYQIENSYLAAAVLHEILHIPPECIRAGIAAARWPGRFETISKNGRFVIDGAHNEDAARKLRDTVRNYFTNRKITYIIGVLADKEHGKMLGTMLPLADRVYTVTPPNARALPASRLAEEAARFHGNVTACESIAQAVEQADLHTPPDGVILAFGSLSCLAEIKALVTDMEQGRQAAGLADGRTVYYGQGKD